MAGKLDDMIAPDELVVYRTRYGFREGLTNLLLLSAWIVFIWQTLLWLANFDLGGNLVLFLIIVTGGGVTWSLCTTTAVVTNRRLLCKRGVIRPKIHDIPLSGIERVDCEIEMLALYQGTIRVRAGEIIKLPSVPNGEHVCTAIREQLGLPQPPKPTTQVTVSAWSMIIIGIVVGLGLMIEAANLYLHAAEWAAPQIPFVILFIGMVVLLPPLLGGAILIGWVGSNMLMLTIFRVFLSVDEAKQMICTGYHSFSGESRLDRFTRPLYWLFERYVSLLYGQPIRCEDNE